MKNDELSKEEARIVLEKYSSEILRLSNLVSSKNKSNELRKKFYESKAYQDTGIIPIKNKHSNIKVKLGWASIIVEVQNEQMRLMGFKNAPKDVNYIFEENYLSTESEKIHRDAMIYGTSYALIAQGDTDAGEPDILITSESPLNCWGEVNPRTRMLNNFIKVIVDPKDSNSLVGLFIDKNVFIDFKITLGVAEIINIEDNPFGLVPAVRFVNKPSGSNDKGHSEITPSIQSMIYSAQESLTEAAISRRVYTNPHRYILNIDEEAITDEDGNQLNPIDMYSESMLVLTASEGENKSNKVEAGQFNASSPKPFYETIPEYARQVQAETGFPEMLIGIPNGSNPSSADALRIQYKRLLDKCESRARNFSNSWKLLMKIALKLSGKELSREEYFNLKASWKPFRISTPASDADAITKMVQAKILDANSSITLERVGISPDEYLELMDERAKNPSSALMELQKSAGIVQNSNPSISLAVESMERQGNFEV